MRPRAAALALAVLACSSEPPAAPGGNPGVGATSVTLRVNVTGPGTVRIASLSLDCRGLCARTVAKATQIRLDAAADPGAHFSGWLGACAGSAAACDLKLDADAQIEAGFQSDPVPSEQARLSVGLAGSGSGRVRSTPPGIDCPDTCTMTAQNGTSVSLVAEAATGSSFTQWTGACTGSGPCTVNVHGDAAVSASFATAELPDECAGLTPPPPGSPSSFRTIRGPKEGTYCMPATSNGAGVLVFPTEDVHHDPLFHFSFVTPQGAVLNTYDGNWHVMIDQLDGFEAMDTKQINFTPWFLVVFSRDGAVSRKVPAPGAFFVNNPVGGVAVADLERVVSYDEQGAVRFEVTGAALPAFDRQGNLLLLFRENPQDSSLKFLAQWVDASGKKGPVFTAVDLPTPRYSYSLTLQPRIGSGLFLHLETSDEPTGPARRSWVRQFEPFVAASSDAPAWLTLHDATKRMHMAHGGRAYVFMPDPQTQVAACSQRLEVVAPSGKSCGFADFPIAAGPCTTQSIDVGYDGTVIQQLPREMEDVDAQQNATCTWRYWPGYFR